MSLADLGDPFSTGRPIDGSPDDAGLEEEEVVRLEAEIAATRERLTEVRSRVGAAGSDARSALGSELAAGRKVLLEMDDQHREAMATVRSAARSEVERILAEAIPLTSVHVADSSRSERFHTPHAE